MKKNIFGFITILCIGLIFSACGNSSTPTTPTDEAETGHKLVITHNGHGTFKITVSEEGSISSLNPVVEGDTIENVKKGTNLKIVPVPDSGYDQYLAGIKSDDEDFMQKINGYAGSGTDEDGFLFYNIDMPDSDVTVSIDFRVSKVKINGVYRLENVIFEDGTYADNASSLTPEKKALAVAIIIYSNDGSHVADDKVFLGYNKALGLGIKHNRSGLEWCTEDANAYGKYISSITCSDGSDNLELISKFLSETEGLEDDTSDATLYPAFYFAKNYKNVAGSHVLGTEYEDGWYLPSLAELEAIKSQIGFSENSGLNYDLELCGGDRFCYDDEYCEYWTASQGSPTTGFDESGKQILIPKIEYSYFGYKNMDTLKQKKYACAIREF